MSSAAQIDVVVGEQAPGARPVARTFPDDVAAADAELALVFATASLMVQDRDQGARYVDLARRLLDTVPEEQRPRFDVLLGVRRF
jgi:hypothetical protein